MPTPFTQEEFIQRSTEKHNGKYDYSLVDYTTVNRKVKIICPDHGVFEQRAGTHMNRGYGCSKCSTIRNTQKATKTLEEFIEEAKLVHSDKYDYSKVTYRTCKIKVEIICHEHGSFWQSPTKHISQKCGCPKCSRFYKLTHQQFINRCIEKYGDTYDYSNSIYTKCRANIEVICPEHGPFRVSATNHYHLGIGCAKCGGSISKIETKWLNFLNIPDDKQHRQVLLIPNRKIKVDGFDPVTNTVYEFLGDYWHGNLKIFKPDDINEVAKKTFQQLYDETVNRFKILEQEGFSVVYVWRTDFVKWFKYLEKNKNINILTDSI